MNDECQKIYFLTASKWSYQKREVGGQVRGSNNKIIILSNTFEVVSYLTSINLA